jgi:hypothetical protein
MLAYCILKWFSASVILLFTIVLSDFLVTSRIYLCQDNSGTGCPLVAERAFGQPPFSYIWAHDVLSAYLSNSTAAFASVVTRGAPAHSRCLLWILANRYI